MPTIQESSIDLSMPVIDMPSIPTVIAAPVASGGPLRSTLPVSEVLDTVTAQATSDRRNTGLEDAGHHASHDIVFFLFFCRNIGYWNVHSLDRNTGRDCGHARTADRV